MLFDYCLEALADYCQACTKLVWNFDETVKMTIHFTTFSCFALFSFVDECFSGWKSRFEKLGDVPEM